MAKYTPGPWVIDGYNAIVNPVDALYEDGSSVAVCKMLWPTDYRSEDETFANARLISAAPELLEALQKCAAVLSGQDMQKQSLIYALSLAKSALSKATGDAS